ncbi:hypothetical protein AcW1_003978 [Taiwanofungus camphoratus]|nr:hypothetical protein AcW1_003978 [Antrodia cinnamomea]
MRYELDEKLNTLKTLCDQHPTFLDSFVRSVPKPVVFTHNDWTCVSNALSFAVDQYYLGIQRFSGIDTPVLKLDSYSLEDVWTHERIYIWTSSRSLGILTPLI